MKIDYLSEIDFGTGFLFESMGEYVSIATNNVPEYIEVTSPNELLDSNNVVKNMLKFDWSFTSDDTRFLTHDLHPYPAKYIPQIPGNIIARLSLRGELVFDPFGGSGTTALEALRLGRRAISVDANPIATIIGKVKTCNLDRKAITDLHAIRCALATIINDLPEDPEILCKEYKSFIPDIANIDKWFPLSSRGELAMIKSRIEAMESDIAKNIAMLALSRIVLKVSYQDSETRYTSKPRNILSGESIKRFLLALDEIIHDVKQTQPVLRYGVSNFITTDIRKLDSDTIRNESIDLIVTSPPYGNANDYHLYHRFRLLWLGFDPRELAKIEIGSHLRHQKESSGFDSYLNEMSDSLRAMFRVLKPGRYAVLVVGDAIYENVLYKGAESIGKLAEDIGFENLSIFERPIHKTKRSFVSAGRRATTEKLLILRRPVKEIKVKLHAPPYKLWPYEKDLQKRETHQILGLKTVITSDQAAIASIKSCNISSARKLVFTHAFDFSGNAQELTWQAIIENGFASQPSSRKDPKYVTHGLHPYKGKFYPQLAKGLINICGIADGSFILDPFCGSGTTLLEGYLNGHRAIGCDMNPLAAKIAKAEVGILEVNPDVFRETVGTLLEKIKYAKWDYVTEPNGFNESCIEEIRRWFSNPVINKLNWILKTIHNVSDGIICDFLEVILSSIIRDVSHQDPNDLRIRRRKVLLKDADVFSLFVERLKTQYDRIEKFWPVKGYSPNKFYIAKAVEGDSRKLDTFKKMGIENGTIDLILTSPPYATALPYIDTDRLSLLLLFGLDSSKRRHMEQNLIGSREIITNEKREIERLLLNSNTKLSKNLTTYLLNIHHRIASAEVGFRRKNMPALLLRFFQDMNEVLSNCFHALKKGGQAMIVIGDNKIKIDGDYERIPTTDFIEDIAQECGFNFLERIDISVTTENR